MRGDEWRHTAVWYEKECWSLLKKTGRNVRAQEKGNSIYSGPESKVTHWIDYQRKMCSRLRNVNSTWIPEELGWDSFHWCSPLLAQSYSPIVHTWWWFQYFRPAHTASVRQVVYQPTLVLVRLVPQWITVLVLLTLWCLCVPVILQFIYSPTHPYSRSPGATARQPETRNGPRSRFKQRLRVKWTWTLSARARS